MVATPPFTTGNDFLNIYEFWEGTSGFPTETPLPIIGKTFYMDLGVDEVYIDGGYNRLGTWFNASATDTGVLTITSASGATVRVVGAEKFVMSNTTINLGTAASETINGSTGNDQFLYGLAGNDTINGLAGNDKLMGGYGLDTLNGGDGNDVIFGGYHRDTMTGGLGKDTFDFDRITETSVSSVYRDIITDFTLGTTTVYNDRIDLSTIDANSALTGNQAFVYKGAGAFTQGTLGQLRYQKYDYAGTVNDKTIVFGDMNGDRVYDFQIQLNGLKTLNAIDFVL